jgi:hypothetical protein
VGVIDVGGMMDANKRRTIHQIESKYHGTTTMHED